MRKESLSLLEQLIVTPSPSGFEQPVQRLLREAVSDWVDEVRTDLHGNLIAVKNPGAEPRVMLAGHCDQIGFMVQHITDEGFIRFSAIGGVDATLVPGSRVKIWAEEGPVVGVIGKKPIHLLEPEERNKPEIKINKLWIDIAAEDKDDALKRLQIGDCITFDLQMEKLSDDLVAAPAFDDKAGAFVVMDVLRILRRRKIDCSLHSVSTVQEEIGLRGARTSAFGIDPLVGIAIDVTHASDYPEADKSKTGEIKLGEGPVIAKGANINPTVLKLLVEAAESNDIPYQLEAAPRATGTDANAIQITRCGVAAGLISIPNRYMHTQVEVVSLADLENAALLLAETVARIDQTIDFTPR